MCISSKYVSVSKIRLRQSMLIYLKYNPAKFHPNRFETTKPSLDYFL